ncbi:MAG: BTAD domain-containing putative transcriptional regulator, partial [Longimicrobiales bacterium]
MSWSWSVCWSAVWAPYDQRRARLLLELLIECGEPAAATAFYATFAARLLKDLDLKPTAQIEALAEGIRKSHAPPVNARAQWST